MLFESFHLDGRSTQCVIESMVPIFGNEIGRGSFFFQQEDK